MLAATASYASLFVLLLWEALRGDSLVSRDATAIASLIAWSAVTVLALGWIGRGSRRTSQDGLHRMAA